jgi:hypothetical protein
VNRLPSTDAELQQIMQRNPALAARNRALLKGGATAPAAKPKRRKIAAPKSELAPPQVVGQIREGLLINLAIALPIRTESELNRRDHWAAAAARKKAQQREVEIGLKRLFSVFRVELPCVVRLTRIGAEILDDDNLASAFKAIRDQIAKLIKVDDGSDMVRWQYDQVADRRFGYGVKIEILRPFEGGIDG